MRLPAADAFSILTVNRSRPLRRTIMMGDHIAGVGAACQAAFRRSGSLGHPLALVAADSQSPPLPIGVRT